MGTKRISTDQLNAIILAGGINHIPLYEGYTPGYKALVPFGGKPTLQYTLDALIATPAIERVGIVGPAAELRSTLSDDALPQCDFVPGGETLMESIANGLRHFATSSMVLIITADLPLITAQAVADFLTACSKVETSYEENVLISVVAQRCYTGIYEEAPKPLNRFKDMAVSHGNLALADPRLLNNAAAISRMNPIYNARKNPFGAAMAIGWRVGLSYCVGVELLHLLTLQQMSHIASQRFHLGLIPVICEHPEITIDVDEAADYEFIKAQLARMQ